MSKYTASPFGIVPEFISEIQNFQYRAPLDSDISGVTGSTSQESLFSSKHTIDRSTGDTRLPLNYSPKYHEDGAYDLSTTNIINQLKGTRGPLKYADFAYCRDFGVYPNNRLIICRKFGGPVGDDLSFKTVTNVDGEAVEVKTGPVATVISWFDETAMPVTVNFGVNWTEAEGSFKNVLNNMGKDIGLDKVGIQLGEVASKGLNFLPLPGIMEPFTKKMINAIFGANTVNERTVSGAPNLIKEAKQRMLIPDDAVGSGLNGKITVVVKCAWEQKFIMGKDPTHVYHDLLRTILHFGGEDGTFYAGGNLSNVVGKLLAFLENPMAFITKILTAIMESIRGTLKAIEQFIRDFFDKQDIPDDTSKGQDAVDAIKDPTERAAAQIKLVEDAKAAEKRENNASNKKNQDNKTKFINQITSFLGDSLKTATSGLGEKYKHVLIGIVNALSGGASTPWHVTIGNPLRPIFSCGDLWTSDVKLTLGPTLAFNDLPSSIEIDFTLQSGRNYGIGEIFRKLSTGDVRITSKSAPSFYNDEGNLIEEKKELNGSGSPATDAKDEALPDGLHPSEITAKSKVDNTNSVAGGSSNAALINSDPCQDEITQAPIQLPVSQLTGGSLVTNTQTAGFASGGGFTNPSLTSGSTNFNSGLLGSQNLAPSGLSTNNPLGGLQAEQQSRVELLNSSVQNTQPSGLGFGVQDATDVSVNPSG